MQKPCLGLSWLQRLQMEHQALYLRFYTFHTRTMANLYWTVLKAVSNMSLCPNRSWTTKPRLP